MFRTDTALGRFLNDARSDLSVKHVARKHRKPIPEVRVMRYAVTFGAAIGGDRAAALRLKSLKRPNELKTN